MNIYKISQDKNQDYDYYDSAVVVAESEQKARETNPSKFVSVINNKWVFISPEGRHYDHDNDAYDDWIPFRDIHKLKVELIGTTDLQPCVILASYNAG